MQALGYRAVTHVASRATILLLATSFSLICKSARMVIIIWMECTINTSSLSRRAFSRLGQQRTNGGKAYHDKNATMKPSHEKKNTRPYGFTTLNIGIERALLVTGLTLGLTKRNSIELKVMFKPLTKPRQRNMKYENSAGRRRSRNNNGRNRGREEKGRSYSGRRWTGG